MAWIECLLRRLREIEKSRLNGEIRRLKRERPGLFGKEYCALATLALAEIGFLNIEGRLETRLHVQRASEFERLTLRPQKHEITNEPGIVQKTNGLLSSDNLSETQEPGSLRHASRAEP